MPLPALFFGGYVVVGVVVATVIVLNDFSKKRVSIAGIFGDIAGFHAIGFLIFLVLWPLWLAILLSAGKDEGQSTQREEVMSHSASKIRDEKANLE